MAIALRALERDDLRFVHDLNNNTSIMNYWFEEPYESFVELEDLYLKHIHGQSERRFVAELEDGTRVGLVELIEISVVHRRCEFQIIVAPNFQGQGFGRQITNKALHYAFCVLNLHKVYLVVSTDNPAAIHLYKQLGFKPEGHLISEHFVQGQYQDAYRMYWLQDDYLTQQDERSID